jgi:hypothetical protein
MNFNSRALYNKNDRAIKGEGLYIFRGKNGCFTRFEKDQIKENLLHTFE